MLTLTGKIIAKIIANHIKRITNKLVDTQQSGILKEQNITDNILTFKLAQDFAKLHKKQLLFMKLDFMKAYDRVSHTFIWATVEAMGFNQKIILLIKAWLLELSLKSTLTADSQSLSTWREESDRVAPYQAFFSF